MKKFKKIFAALAASALVAAMSFTSMAASITINIGAPEGTSNDDLKTTYEYYKVLNANVLYKNDNPDDTEIENASYYLDNSTDQMYSVIENTNLFKMTSSNVSTRVNVELADPNTTGETIATKLNEAITNADIDATGTFKQKSEKNAEGKDVIKVEATDLSDGYYLVKSSLGTAIVVSTTGNKNVTITEKNHYPTITKIEKDGKTTASYGDMLTYVVSVAIPDTATNNDIVIYDTMDSSLIPYDANEDGKIDVTATLDGNNFENFNVGLEDGKIKITIPGDAVADNHDKTVKFTYAANLGNTAGVNTDLKNTAYLTYAGYKSLPVEVTVKTYDFVLTKVDGAKKNTNDHYIPETAGDAEFTLWDAQKDGKQIKVSLHSENKYRVLTSGEKETVIYAGGKNHSATIEGLAAGTYYLQEDNAPKGYNKLTERMPIVVKENQPTGGNKVDVENNAGIKLPSTGGMGTTVFAIVGLLVMAGAAVTLIVKKRA